MASSINDSRLFSDDDIKSMFEMVDEDKDGHITLKEFQEFLAKFEISKDVDESRSVFEMLDADKDGKVTLEESKKGLSDLMNVLKAFDEDK